MNLFENLQKMNENNESKTTVCPNCKEQEIDESNVVEDVEQLDEAAELKPFTMQDWYGFQGCNKFEDGSEPLVAYGDFATLIIDGTEGVNMSIYYGEDFDKWSFKTYSDKDSAIKDGKLLLKLIDDEIDEEQLTRFGFTKVQ